MFKAILGPQIHQKWNLLGIYAAALGFYMVLSLVPFLIVTFTCLDYFQPIDITPAVSRILSESLPAESHVDPAIILKSVKKFSNGGALTIGFVGALWTSINLMSLIVRALHFVFSDPKRQHPGTWRTHLGSIALLLVWMATFVSSALFLVVAPIVEKALTHLYFISAVLLLLWSAIKIIGIFFILTFAFALTYRFIPERRHRSDVIWKGAALAAAGWLIVSLGLGQFVPWIWKRNALSGALGSAIAVMLWGYACAWVFLLGACWMVRFGEKN